MWYCRHEIQFRQALFFSAASIAGAFSGLLAFGISKMHGVGGLEGWRWIFILEGIVTVLVAVWAFFALHDFPETASFLSEEERAFVVFRLKYQSQIQGKQIGQVAVPEAEEFKWRYVGDAFKDWQIWVNIFVYWGVRFDNSTEPRRNKTDSIFADCLSSLRYQSISTYNYPQSWIHIEHGAVDDRPDLRHRCDSGGHHCLHLRQGRQAEPLHRGLLVCDDRRLLHVFGLGQPPRCLCRCLHRGLCHLPSISRCHYLAGEQLGRQLQAQCRHGHPNWCW